MSVKVIDSSYIGGTIKLPFPCHFCENDIVKRPFVSKKVGGHHSKTKYYHMSCAKRCGLL